MAAGGRDGGARGVKGLSLELAELRPAPALAGRAPLKARLGQLEGGNGDIAGAAALGSQAAPAASSFSAGGPRSILCCGGWCRPSSGSTCSWL